MGDESTLGFQFPGGHVHWRIQRAANRVSQPMAGPKVTLAAPFKADIVLKTVFGQAKRYHFHRLDGFGRPLANGLDPPVVMCAPPPSKKRKPGVQTQERLIPSAKTA